MHVPLSIHTHSLPLYLFSYYSIYLFFLYPPFLLTFLSFRSFLSAFPTYPFSLRSFFFSIFFSSLSSFLPSTSNFPFISSYFLPCLSHSLLFPSSFPPFLSLSLPLLLFSLLPSISLPLSLSSRVPFSVSVSFSLLPCSSLSFLLFPYSPSRSPDPLPFLFTPPPLSVLLSSQLLSPLLFPISRSLSLRPSYSSPLSPLFPSLLPLLLSLLPFSFLSFPYPHVYLLFLLSLFRCSVCLSFFLRSSPSPSPFLLFYASSSRSLLFRLLYFLPSPLPFFLSSPLLSLL